MSQSSLSAEEVKEQGTATSLIEKWEKHLAEEGLSGELAPLIPKEVQELFPMDSENVADDFEAAIASDAGDTPPDIAPEEIILTTVERRIVERIKSLGWAATLDEANATDEQIARLADSGTAFLRATDSGETVLAMANATNSDVRRAGARIEKPRIEKFSPRLHVKSRLTGKWIPKPATPTVMFLEHHTDEKVPGEAAKARAAEEFRAAARAAGAKRRREQETARQTATRIVGRLRRDGEETSRVISAGPNPQRVWAIMERLQEKGLVSRGFSRSDGVVFRWEGSVPYTKVETPARQRHWTEEPGLRRRVEAQRRSGQAARNAARAIRRRLTRRERRAA